MDLSDYVLNPLLKRKTTFLLSIIFGFLIFSSCENDIKKVNLYAPDEKKLPSQVLIDAEMIFSDSAELKAIIKTPELNNYTNEKPYQEFPKGVKVDIYENGVISSNLKSNYAINYQKDKIMEAKSNVIVTNAKGEILNTEHLIWDQNKKIIYSDVFVKITTQTQIWCGKGFESDEQFEKWTLKNPTGIIDIKKDEIE